MTILLTGDSGASDGNATVAFASPSIAAFQLAGSYHYVVSNQGYREVIDHNPLWRGRSMVKWDEPGDHEPLPLKSCTQCHFSGSEVRSPLARENADSVRYLVRNLADRNGFMGLVKNSSQAEMPIEGHALSEVQLTCLDAWLNRDHEAIKSKQCTAIDY